MPPEQATKEGADGDDAAGGEEAAASDDNDGLTSLHVSCKDFSKLSGAKVQKWLAHRSQVTMHKVFKLPKWMFAFVTVDPDQAAKFREDVDGATYSKNTVVVKDGNPRGAGSKRPNGSAEGEPGAKRQKGKEFPNGYVPTLKDLKDRAAKRKGAGQPGEESIVQKSAPLLEWPYETQLSMKGTYVKSAVRSFTKMVKKRCEERNEAAPDWTTAEWSNKAGAPIGCGCPLDETIGTAAGSLQGYRNKCEFSIGNATDGQAEVGFVLRVTHDGDQVIASADDLPHVPEAMKRMAAALRSCVRRSGLPIFDRRRGVKTGVWRTVMARRSPTGEMLLMVQTSTLDAETQKKVVDLLVEDLRPAEEPSRLGVVSIYLQFNDEVTDAARPDCPLHCVHGEPRLLMPLLGLKFDLGPLSFFQANSATCESLYGKAIEWLRPAGAVMLDICCGVGTIGLCAARHSQTVIGVELIAEAVESAKQNAKLNGIENAEFVVGKAEDVMPEILQKLPAGTEVTAMVDPPRVGLHKTVLAALRQCSQLSRLVYVSCNPDSLAEDVVKLTGPEDCDPDPFVPVRAVAVDMFPHTLHVEMILLLERASRVSDPRKAAAPAASAASSAADADAAAVTPASDAAGA